MKVNEYQSKESGLVKPVSLSNEASVALSELEDFFIRNRIRGNVKEWNELRIIAMENYDEQFIRMLDGSGFINEWLLYY